MYIYTYIYIINYIYIHIYIFVIPLGAVTVADDGFSEIKG
jgi:hypothetical protein